MLREGLEKDSNFGKKYKMPELPEVETIRRDLEPRVVGKRLLGYGLVKGFGRVGKIMFFELEGKYLLVHL